MWKYSSKNHLKILLFAFVVGVLMMVVAFSQSADVYAEVFSQEIVDFMYSNIALTYISGGLSIAAIANSILLIQLLMKKSPLGIFIILGILMFSAEWIVIIGVVMLIPAIIANIYGAVTLSHQIKSEMKTFGFSSEADLVEEYKSKHALKEEVRPLAEMCRKQNDKMTYIYFLGIVALICIMCFVSNFIVLVVAFVFYSYAFSYLNHYRISNFIPIRQLLYDKCDPEACASAIIYFSYKHNRYKCQDHALLAQCLVYMDDAELARKVLVNYPKNNESVVLTYYSMLAYIYYLQKNEEKLQECKEKASKVRLNYGRTGVVIQSSEIAMIQNKIDLLNGNLNECRKYYLQTYQRANMNSQKVDSAYFIALISFVEEDYIVAKTYFEKVVQLGNTMYFVKRAENYLSKINSLNIDEEIE